jgi:hypothetical protein
MRGERPSCCRTAKKLDELALSHLTSPRIERATARV